MEKPIGYYAENEMKQNLQAGAEVAGILADAFKPVTDVAKHILVREVSHVLRSIVFKR